MPLGILAASVLIVVGIVFEPPGASEAAADCSGALSTDYACYQERYQNLVNSSGVRAAFVDLKDQYKKNEFVRASCHQLTHVIGRSAADLYGNVGSAYSRGALLRDWLLPRGHRDHRGKDRGRQDTG